MAVTILLLSLLILGVIVALGHLFFNRGESDEVIGSGEPSCASCSGSDERCEQECMMKAATEPTVYYDDEELDRFKGRDSDSYTEAETTEFREVMETLAPGEAQGWNRSLLLRGINVPDALKDELIMLINDN